MKNLATKIVAVTVLTLGIQYIFYTATSNREPTQRGVESCEEFFGKSPADADVRGMPDICYNYYVSKGVIQPPTPEEKQQELDKWRKALGDENFNRIFSNDI